MSVVTRRTTKQGHPLRTPGASALEKRFHDLAQRWKAETTLMSSSTDIANHSAYREIIRMGNGAIPFILSDLKTSDSHWRTALHATIKLAR